MKTLEQNYNEIVGITLVNLWTLSKEEDTINFTNLDYKNEEHRYLLHVAMTSYGVINKPIRLNLPIWKRKKIAKLTGCEKIEWKKKAKKANSINVAEVLEFMHPVGVELTGDKNFSFADIYHEFYERKGENE